MTGPHIGHHDHESGRGKLLAEWPLHMREGIQEQWGGSAVPGNPAEREARLAAPRARAPEATGSPPGGWQAVGREQAARELTEQGFDLDTARRMVTGYLREVSERVGVSAYQWGLDQGDVAAIAGTAGQRTADTADTDTAGTADTAVLGDGAADKDGDAAGWLR